MRLGITGLSVKDFVVLHDGFLAGLLVPSQVRRVFEAHRGIVFACQPQAVILQHVFFAVGIARPLQGLCLVKGNLRVVVVLGEVAVECLDGLVLEPLPFIGEAEAAQGLTVVWVAFHHLLVGFDGRFVVFNLQVGASTRQVPRLRKIFRARMLVEPEHHHERETD